MFGLRGLNRTVATSMALVALGGVAITFLGLALVYGLMLEQPWRLKGVDYVAIAVFCICGLIMAVASASALTRRIVSPVASVGQAARRIADGDLSARAEISDPRLGEVVELTTDFNQMADRLESLAAEERTINAAVAHELRTPLMILRGKIQGAIDGVFPLDEDLLLGALGQIDALTRLVDDIRAMGVADSGHVFLDVAPIDLADVARDLRRLLHEPFRMAGFDARWVLRPAPVLADRTRVQQALLALLGNARLHAAPGPLLIEVVEVDGMGLFRITDSGPGIPAELSDRIFEPFRRGPTMAKGTGLGLAIVRITAEAHEGSATYRSSATGGSIFEFFLPRANNDRSSSSPEKSGCRRLRLTCTGRMTTATGRNGLRAPPSRGPG